MFVPLCLTDTSSAGIYTLSLHDALPIYRQGLVPPVSFQGQADRSERTEFVDSSFEVSQERSEEHTSELQSRGHLVCRLLLEKKKRPARSEGNRTVTARRRPRRT